MLSVRIKNSDPQRKRDQFLKYLKNYCISIYKNDMHNKKLINAIYAEE